MPTPEQSKPLQTKEAFGMIVIGHAGSLTIAIVGGKIVVIPPEDPSWGSIIAKATAAAAVARVEGPASQIALRFAAEAAAAAQKVLVVR